MERISKSWEAFSLWQTVVILATHKILKKCGLLKFAGG
jgi:hypothetical protein